MSRTVFKLSLIHISTAVKEGNTYYYFSLQRDDVVYIAPITISDDLPLMAAGDQVELEVVEGQANYRQVTSIQVSKAQTSSTSE